MESVSINFSCSIFTKISGKMYRMLASPRKFGKVKRFYQIINKTDSRCNYDKPKSQQKTKKRKQKGTM